MSQPTFLLWPLSLAKIFVATYKSLMQQTCLGSSQLSFNFCCNRSSFCRNKILSFHSFYCRDIKILCRDRDFSFTSLLRHNVNFFVTIHLVLLFNFLSLPRIDLPRVVFVATEIIFVATEILLLLVVNSKCHVT